MYFSVLVATYLTIASANKKRRKKRSWQANNYLKTRHFGIINDLQLRDKYEIFYLKILHECPE
jgi:hypothetical protein